MATILSVIPAPEARADRVARLIQMLKTGDYRLRLQACISLRRHRDRRAVGPLVGYALKHEKHTLRAMAAVTLGQIGDASAVPALRQALGREKDGYARSEIKKALDALTVSIGPGVRFFITVGKISNTSGTGGAQLSQALAEALLKEFGGVSGVTTKWPGGGRPRPAELGKRRIKAFVLDGALLSATGKRSGSYVEVSCSIRVSLATYPQNSMKAFYSGGAAMQVSPQEFRPANEVNLFKEVIAGAATGARKQIVSSYLAAQ